MKATTRPRSAIRNVIVALSFLVSGQYFKVYHKILWTLSLDQVNSTPWIHIVEWLAPFVKQIADWSVKEARTEAIQLKNQSSLHIQFDGFYLTRGHYSNNSSAQLSSATVQAPVVEKLDSAIHRINHYPVDNAVGFPNTYPLDSDLSGGQRYPTFEQLGPGCQRQELENYRLSDLAI